VDEPGPIVVKLAWDPDDPGTPTAWSFAAQNSEITAAMRSPQNRPVTG